nr:helix-turn-helix transcriptional regulator [Streptomyces atriruber]
MPPLDAAVLGKRIAATHKARRMRQADLARAAHLSLAMIRGIEQGARNPSDPPRRRARD